MATSNSRVVIPTIVVALIVSIYAGPVPAAGARVLSVANDGIDSIHCGDRTDQCRSISQAIGNAHDGDTISVGLGRYGDVNGDGDFDDPGDEHAQLSPLGAGCMICITKSVAIISLHGADVTVIDAGASPDLAGITAVEIRAPGVRFGNKDKGFTVTGGYVGIAAGSFGGRIGGNTAVQNQFINISYALLDNGPLTVEDNTAASAQYGINGGAEFEDRDATLQRNILLNNDLEGLIVGGNAKLVTGNIAILNGGGGIAVRAGNNRIEGNTAVANREGVSAGGAEELTGQMVNSFRRNSALGNRVAGLFIQGPVATGVHENNTFGNGTVALPQGSPDEGLPGVLNCGLVNASGRLLQASGNFWGSASGPGPDPADGKCDLEGSVTITKPAATTPTGVASE